MFVSRPGRVNVGRVTRTNVIRSRVSGDDVVDIELIMLGAQKVLRI